MLNWPNKDPDEVLDYSVDWSTRLSASETISSRAVSVLQGTVVINSISNTDTRVSLWLSGGTLNEQCKILVRITTNQGRIMDQTVGIKIKAA